MKDLSEHLSLKKIKGKDKDENKLELELLIPAYLPDTEHGESRVNSPKHIDSSRIWLLRHKIAILLAIIISINCFTLLVQSSATHSRLETTFSYIIPINSWAESFMPVRTDEALPLERSTALDDSIAIFPEDILHSALHSSECKASSPTTRRSLAEKRGLALMTVQESGGRVHQCMDDWTSELPELQRILAVGFNPRVFPPKKISYKSLEKSITLVTQVSINNLHVIEDQCRLWRGLPLVAVVYVPIQASKDSEKQTKAAVLDGAVLDVLRMVKKIHAGNYCELKLEVVAERLCSNSDQSMPLNALRNRGLRLAMTSGVLLTDGHHLLSHRIPRAIKDSHSLSSMLYAARQSPGLVIPSFSPANPWYGKLGRQLALEVATMPGKFLIEKAVKHNQLEGPFGWMTNDPSQLTPIEVWSSIKEGNDAKVRLHMDASSQVLMLKEKIPYFDERLRGSHLSQSLHMRHSELLSGKKEWAIMGVGWAIRVGSLENNIESKSLQQMNRRLYDDSVKLIKNDSYVPIVGLQELCYRSRVAATAKKHTTNKREY